MKSKIIKNESTQGRSGISSGNREANYITQHGDKKEYKNPKASNDSNRINSSFYRSYNDNTYENLFLKNLVDNLFEYIGDQNNKEKSFNIIKNELYPMRGEKEKFLALENFDCSKINMLENNNNNFNIDISKEHIYEKGAAKFNIENDPNRKNSGLGLGYPTQKDFAAANFNQKDFNEKETLNNGKLKAKEILKNADFNDIKINKINNFDDTKTSPLTVINHGSKQNSSKNFKLNLSNQNDNNTLTNNVKDNELHKRNSNVNANNRINLNNFNLIAIREDSNNRKRNDLNLALNEEDKSIYMKSFKSPNPFEDYSFGQNSNIFNSPNPMEGIMYKLSNEVLNDKMNFNFDLSRNSTLEYNDIFKSTAGAEQLEDKKLPKESNLFYDDSFFSISSNDRKSEANSELIYKSKNLEKAPMPMSTRSLN